MPARGAVATPLSLPSNPLRISRRLSAAWLYPSPLLTSFLPFPLLLLLFLNVRFDELVESFPQCTNAALREHTPYCLRSCRKRTLISHSNILQLQSVYASPYNILFLANYVFYFIYFLCLFYIFLYNNIFFVGFLRDRRPLHHLSTRALARL